MRIKTTHIYINMTITMTIMIIKSLNIISKTKIRIITLDTAMMTIIKYNNITITAAIHIQITVSMIIMRIVTVTIAITITITHTNKCLFHDISEANS